MSMFVFGDIVLSRTHGEPERIATEIGTQAGALGIYMKFGGNVSNQYIRVADRDVPALAFEITDSIVDNTATLLFAPLGVEAVTYGDDAHCPRPDRIQRITSLLAGIVDRADVNKVILNMGVAADDIAANTRTVLRTDLPGLFGQLFQEDDIRERVYILKEP